jgi:hypothetical protein
MKTAIKLFSVALVTMVVLGACAPPPATRS